MAINSKRKGKRGELYVVNKFKDRGYQCNRTAQFKGNTGRADDIEGIDYIHAEVKFVERLNISDAMEQAVRDKTKAKSNKQNNIFFIKNTSFNIFYSIILYFNCQYIVLIISLIACLSLQRFLYTL